MQNDEEDQYLLALLDIITKQEENTKKRILRK